MAPQSMRFPVYIRGNTKDIEANALLDSGATGLFIHQDYVKKHRMPTKPYARPKTIRNVDNSFNILGKVSNYVETILTIGEHEEQVKLAVTNIGEDQLILGLPWLRRHNPNLDWAKGQMAFDRCPISCQIQMKRKRRQTKKPEKVVKLHKPANIFAGIRRTVASTKPKEDAFVSRIKQLYQLHREKVAQRDFLKQIEFEDGDELWETWEDEEDIIRKTSKSTELAEEVNRGREARTFEEIVPKPYHHFKKVFDDEESKRFPTSKPWDHRIDLKPDIDPRTTCKVYPLTPQEQIALDKFLQEHLERGTIRKSSSPLASPFFFVKKKDGKLRPVQDYRKLNEMTIKNKYPLPLVTELVDRMSSAKYFTKMDVREGYNNVRIKDGHQWKAAFLTNRGLYEPMVMFFGLTNSPATFQTMMDDIFQDLIATGKVVIYMDDILIGTDTLEEHRSIVTEILKRLQDNDLFLKPEKCTFEVQEVDYLGIILGHGKISMDPAKIKGVLDWPTPSNLTDVRAFLGFGNFYRRFIKNFSDKAKPLNDLTRKDVSWRWTDKEQKAFDELKHAFTTAPVIIQPDSTKPFRVECDASGFAIGGVLSQEKNGRWHPCAYLSQSMTEAERNYDVHDRELLAIMKTFATWRHYLVGNPHRIDVWSDHRNLEYFRTSRKLNRRQARWSGELQDYDFQITHKPGKIHAKPDALSRRKDHDDGSHDNEDKILLPDNLFVRSTNNPDDIRDRIRNSRHYDPEAESYLKSLISNNPTMQKDLINWKTVDGMLIYKNKIYIPNDIDLRRDLTQLHHDNPAAGHRGEAATILSLSRDYWWPKITQFVRNYVKGCTTCQSTKIQTRRPSVPSIPIEAESTLPFHTVTMDLITDLPESHGYNSIAVFVDHDSSKAAIMTPCKTSITAEEAADLYIHQVFRHFGLANVTIQDRGTQFNAHFARELYKKLGIQQRFSTAYHPQTDGGTERVNQELEQYLRAYCNFRQNNWSKYLIFAEFAHNSAVHGTTSKAPFYLLMGYHPRWYPDIHDKTTHPSVERRLEELRNAREDAKSAHALAANLMRNEAELPKFKEGDKVWLEGKNITTTHPSAKLRPKRFGPFPIIKALGPITFKLKLPHDWKIHPVFHASLLTPYRQTSEYGPVTTEPPPIIINDEEQYEVDAILDAEWRSPGGRKHPILHYLVHYTGYDNSENQWRPHTEFDIDDEVVEEFYKQHPTAPSLTNKPTQRKRTRPRRR